MKKKSDYTILIQGRVDVNTLNLWLKNYKDYNVVLSIWEDVDLTKFKFPKNWIIVVNQYPLVRFREGANLDYQIITTLKGIEKVNTKWVIKVRADEYYSNLDFVYDKITKTPEKITTSSVFFRKWGLYKFHCSDKLIAGTTDNVRLMFESTLLNIQLDLFKYIVPESQLGFGFIYAKEPNFDLDLLDVKRTNPFNESKATDIMNSGMDVVGKKVIEILSKKTKYNHFSWDDVIKDLVLMQDIIKECISEISYRGDKYLKVFDDIELMKKWFEIVDVNDLKPYIITRNYGDTGRVWYNDDFDHKENDCLTDINED
jgi:hypothetical protein